MNRGKSLVWCAQKITGLPKLADLHQQALTKDMDPILKHEVDFVYFVFYLYTQFRVQVLQKGEATTIPK